MGQPKGIASSRLYNQQIREACIKWAMTDAIKHPPKGFETVIRRHFYLQRTYIERQCDQWLAEAQKWATESSSASSGMGGAAGVVPGASKTGGAGASSSAGGGSSSSSSGSSALAAMASAAQMIVPKLPGIESHHQAHYRRLVSLREALRALAYRTPCCLISSSSGRSLLVSFMYASVNIFIDLYSNGW